MALKKGAMLLAITAAPLIAHCAETTIRLTVDFKLIGQKLAEQVYTEAGNAQVWRESDCRYLSLDSPALSHQDGQLRLTTHGVGSFGAEVLETCVAPLAWKGYIESLIEPYIGSDWQLRFHVRDSDLYDEAWSKGLVSGLLWEVTERFFLPRLGALSIDLAPPRDELLSLIKVSVPADQSQIVKTVLNTAAPGDVTVQATGVVVPIVLRVPAAWVRPLPTPSAPEAPLTGAELDAFQHAMERWDAFLVFVIKGFGEDLVDPQIREQLFDLLMSSRYDLVPVLTGEITQGQGDPVRRVFAESWRRLHRIVEEGAERGLLGAKMLRYAGFISAGDVLVTLERSVPGLGIQISADGLRRLARMLRPEAIADPLLYGYEVDPKLREMFGLPPELPAEPPPEFAPQNLFEWISKAYAEQAISSIAALKKRLHRWVPQGSELVEYSQLMERLLTHTREKVLARAALDAGHAPLYAPLLLATALKESCWRQYQRNRRGITYLKSTAGAIGLMQVNPRYWRGFYQVEQLQWNTAYNAHAGAEILMQYFRRYGLKEGQKTGKLENAARAAYSVYNA
ncbi:MAG: hypothetical protein ACREXR_10065, partial [Gammaproteobacteria bacterium]